MKLGFFKRDHFSTPAGQGALAGLTEICYIALVAIFMVGTESLFAAANPWLAVFGIIAVLALLVMSVAVSGVLLLGWPLYYFFERKYKEGLYALSGSIAAMFIVFAVIFVGALIATTF